LLSFTLRMYFESPSLHFPMYIFRNIGILFTTIVLMHFSIPSFWYYGIYGR